MPNNADNPLNQGQPSGQGSIAPGTPQGQIPIRRGGHKQQKPHYQRVPQGQNLAQVSGVQMYQNQREQQPIRLPAQAGRQQVDAEAVETQRQPELSYMEQVAGPHGSEMGGANAAEAQAQRTSERREPAGTFEYFLIGVIALLIIAIIATFISFISFLNTHSFDPGRFGWIVLLLLIYALCVFVGGLWGRYQLDTAAKKESEQLKEYVTRLQSDNVRLRSERDSLRGKLYSTETELARIRNMPPPAAPPASRIASGPLPQVVKSPEQIERIQPQKNIYDVTLDPPDFNEMEQREHPHEKFYPERGKSWTLRSGWNIIGASRRGYGHAYEGKYREDDFEIRNIRMDSRNVQLDMVMVAIADGVSSKAHSRRGARAAVQGAISITNTSVHLQELGKCIGKNEPLDVLKNPAFNALMESLSAAHAFVEQQAQYYRISVDDMHSTLLVYLAIPVGQQLFVASVQVGDGALFAMRAVGATPRERWRWLQHPQIQASGNEVQPFMRTGPDLWQRYLQADLLDNPSFIMGMTDGTADDIEAPRPTPEVADPDPFYFVDDFYQHIRQAVANSPQPAEALLKFLDYKKKQSFDDRTVVCLYR